ncbi:uncharacterized protein BDW47DRAFT_68075 [Aspergillus candidus]|uniref:Uncharacterized protein n=1 Tax=Aspergillus candidus TaxID=41067 RepID=A0A2I2F3N9_ASPCN|nr:hypothetical protein BDW47DRAFT_68075 [Aspergillus candidus]PLB35208.1 hypothetical protein BDW47DRAFT_68075 [Aspergillus candidus]
MKEVRPSHGEKRRPNHSPPTGSTLDQTLHSLVGLHLMITPHRLRIRWRSMRLIRGVVVAVGLAAALATTTATTAILVLGFGRRLCGRSLRIDSAIAPLGLKLRGLVRDVVVGHTATFDVVPGPRPWDRLVVGIVVVGLRVSNNYVPGMEESGDIPQATEGKVNDRVGGA